MATTVDDIARASLAAVGSNAGLFLVIGWASERYRQLTARIKPKHLRRIGEVVLPAPIDDGLATATRNADTVTGNATATAAWQANPDVKDGNWYFRARRVGYRIPDGNPSGVLKLESPFSEVTSSAVAYKLVKRYHRL